MAGSVRRVVTALLLALLLTIGGTSRAFAAGEVAAPNDPLWPEQWALDARPGVGLNVLEAWKYSKGAGIVVAVVDTGITNHPEFKGRVLPGYDFVSNERAAGDGDGRDADPSDPGDYITEEEIQSGGVFAGCRAEDSSWHGTHVAGIVLAAANNKEGVVGVAPEAKLLPVRALGKCGGSDSDLVDSLRWAAGLPVSGAPENQNPARIINVSLGGEGACSSRMQGAVDEISANGAIIVVSVGNANRDASFYSPANCRGTLTVGALTRDGIRSSYSNFGDYVDLSAPGGDDLAEVLNAYNGGLKAPEAATYKAISGTSMSTPHVSGALALAWSADPTLPRDELISLLFSSLSPFVQDGSSLGCTQQSLCGAGAANAGALLAALVARPEPQLVVSGASVMEVGSSQAFAVTLEGSDARVVVTTTELCALSEGVLTALGRGNCVLQFTQGSSARYRAANKTINVRVSGLQPAVVIDPIATIKVRGARAVMVQAESDGARTFKSLSKGICSVTANGLIQGKAAGVCKVRVRTAGTLLYEPDRQTLEIRVRR